MSTHPIDLFVDEQMPSALTAYLDNTSWVSISEHLHASSHHDTSAQQLARLSHGRRPELYEDLFAHLTPVHIPPPVPSRPQPTSVAAKSLRKQSTAPTAPPANQDVPSSSSPPPSLDSREPSEADSSVCTDDLIIAPRHQNILDVADQGLAPLRMVAASRYADSDFLMQLSPETASDSEDENDGDAVNPSSSSAVSLRCAFWFLGCRKRHRNEERWLRHCNLHLTNRSKDPRPIPCRICGKSFGGWNRWLRHVADHQRDGFDLKHHGKVADPQLVPRLWGANVIKDAEWLEIIQRGRLRDGGGVRGGMKFTHMHDPIRERRRVADAEWRG